MLLPAEVIIILQIIIYYFSNKLFYLQSLIDSHHSSLSLIQALFFGGLDKLPDFLARHTIPVIGVVVDPSAAVLVLIVTFLLCTGIKEVLIFP